MSRIEELQHRAQDLAKKLASPELLSRPEELARLSRELKEINDILILEEKEEQRRMWRKEAERILAESRDPELRILAEQDLAELDRPAVATPRREGVRERVIVEIRPGTGGDEAALFAYTLARMYIQVAQRQKWDVAVLEESLTELGGVRSLTLSVAGPSAHALLAHEAGVHRVQRIPVTEKSGRIHTSTVTVAVLPEPQEKEVVIRPSDMRVETMRASGPGGQFVNRRESAVRITHIPSGIVAVSQTARTQLANREQALKIVRAKLAAQEQERAQQNRSAARKTQIGMGERAEKIRTYNFPQDRVTDHRIKKSWRNLAKIMDGDIGQILQELQNLAISKS